MSVKYFRSIAIEILFGAMLLEYSLDDLAVLPLLKTNHSLANGEDNA